MSGTIFRSKLLCDNTWLIQGEGCTSYLVVGDERGLVIDTGFSTQNIQQYAQSLTDSPSGGLPTRTGTLTTPAATDGLSAPS